VTTTSPSKEDSSDLIELGLPELEALIEGAKTELLNEQDCEQLHSVVETLYFLTQELDKKRVSVQRLKQLLFGAKTEKTSDVLKKALDQTDMDDNEPDDDPNGEDSSNKKKKKKKGHGCNGAADYTGAKKVQVDHPSLKGGDDCPNCKKGKVYEMDKPSQLVRIHGQAPLGATVYELQKFRCNLCGKIFKAPAPPEVGPKKYNAEAIAMIALLKYGSGMPFNRSKQLQDSLGIPLPASTQWETILKGCDPIKPALEELIRQGAQGQVLHNDDTTMKVLSLAKELQKKIEEEPGFVPSRKGIFTTGIVSILEDHRIALYFTGHNHAGENLTAVLEQRASELPWPIQMCDALSRNMPDGLETLLANCLTHGRRNFVEVSMNFPQECLYVLEILKEVYINDAQARRQKLSPEQRLQWHQAQSGPKMVNLKTWLTEQFDQNLVEPNSSLGGAITYMLKHWDKLTLFLREPGAPLDNNICERALKKAILHRKNAYFYKTENGARVGDLFMSLIHTCELNRVNPFDYLTELQKHAGELASNPDNWMPWNYRDTLNMNHTPENK